MQHSSGNVSVYCLRSRDCRRMTVRGRSLPDGDRQHATLSGLSTGSEAVTGPYVSNCFPHAFGRFVGNLQLPIYGRAHRHLRPPRGLFQSATQSLFEMETTSSEHADRSHACTNSYRPREGDRVCNASVGSLSKERINSSAVDRLKHACAGASRSGGASSAAISPRRC